MHKRIYFVTGKGGVGKTTLSLCLTKQLQQDNKDKKIFYTSYDQKQNSYLCEQLNLPFLYMNPVESVEKYIVKKLKSKIIASGIVKTPFVRAIFQMLPGLENLVIMGEIIDLLKKDPAMIIVFDTPSSGHAVTLFESLINFKEIFVRGVLADDIDEIWDFVVDPANVNILVTTIPTEMSVHEAMELKSSLLTINSQFNIEMVMNSSLYLALMNSVEKLPDFLKEKIRIEQEIINRNSDLFKRKIAFVTALSQAGVIQTLATGVSLK